MQIFYNEKNSIDIAELYIKEVSNNTSVLTPKKEQELFKRYQEGDLEAKKIIIESNLNLVISYAQKMGIYGNFSHVKFLDLVQEGNIGLIKAVEGFDYSKGEKFSTYATKFIKGAMKRIIATKNKGIHLPERLYWKTQNYKKIVLNYKTKYGKRPSEKILCKEMGISYDELNIIRHQSYVFVDSLNRKIDESEENELESTVVDNNKSTQQFLNKMVDQEWRILLKAILSPEQYFVIYTRYFCENSLSLRQLESYLGVSRTTIMTLEKKAFTTIKIYISDNYKELNQKNYELRKRFGKNFYRINSTCIHPMSILKFIYLKSILTPEEQQLLYLQQFGELMYQENELANFLNMSVKQYRILAINLEKKITDFFLQDQQFSSFVTYMVDTYKTSLFYIDLLHDTKDYMLEFVASSIFQEENEYVRKVEKKIV